jgi:hypothetical protein
LGWGRVVFDCSRTVWSNKASLLDSPLLVELSMQLNIPWMGGITK